MYGWTPEQIGQLTLAQALVYASCGEASVGRVQRFASVAAAQAALAKRGKR